MDETDLQLLMNYIKVNDDVVDERKTQLKKICIKYGINNPLVGEE